MGREREPRHERAGLGEAQEEERKRGGRPHGENDHWIQGPEGRETPHPREDRSWGWWVGSWCHYWPVSGPIWGCLCCSGGGFCEIQYLVYAVAQGRASTPAAWHFVGAPDIH